MSTSTKLNETETFKARKAENEKKQKEIECFYIIERVLQVLSVIAALLLINWFIHGSITSYIDQRVTEEVLLWNS